jgi:hypothetical protein
MHDENEMHVGRERVEFSMMAAMERGTNLEEIRRGVAIGVGASGRGWRRDRDTAQRYSKYIVYNILPSTI